jgi:small subunit ribosomal protein S16
MIRLQRVGRTNIATFRVVLTDSKNSTKSGKLLEVLGTYNPVKNEKVLKTDRVKYWISKGAQPSTTMHNWLIEAKVIPGKKLNALPKKKPIKKEEPKKEGESAPAKAVAPEAAKS